MNKPSPDFWAYWGTLATVRLWHAICLSFGIEPRAEQQCRGSFDLLGKPLNWRKDLPRIGREDWIIDGFLEQHLQDRLGTAENWIDRENSFTVTWRHDEAPKALWQVDLRSFGEWIDRLWPNTLPEGFPRLAPTKRDECSSEPAPSDDPELQKAITGLRAAHALYKHEPKISQKEVANALSEKMDLCSTHANAIASVVRPAEKKKKDKRGRHKT